MLNGDYKCFFKPSRELRQGDPLSPYLFILSEELLSKMLHKAFLEGHIKHFNACGDVRVSHLIYANDLLIFANSNKTSICYLGR